MMTKQLSRVILAALLLAVPLLFTAPAHAQMIVEDPSSIVVLIEQLVHQAMAIDNQVQQIQNQIQSIENEKNMLAHLNLSTAAGALAAMQQIQQTLQMFCVGLQNQGISDPIGFGAGYNCGLVAQELRNLYPAPGDWQTQSDQQIAQYPDQWAIEKTAAAAKAVQTEDASVANMNSTQQRMTTLASASKSASGQTAAIQVTNEMLLTLSGQLRDQQAAELATQRSLAMEQSEEAADYQRNKQLMARATSDAEITYDVAPISDPFGD